MLPVECGRQQIIDEAFVQLSKFPTSDYANELIGLIKNNPINTVETWKKYINSFTQEELTTWIEYGYYLQILHKLEESILLQILSSKSKVNIDRLKIVANANRLDIIENSVELKSLTVESVLNGDISIFPRNNKYTSLSSLSVLYNTFFLSSIFDVNIEEVSMSTHFNNRIFRRSTEQIHDIFSFDINDAIDKQLSDYFSVVKPSLLSKISIWKSSIGPWDTIVEQGRLIFGDMKSLVLIAIISASIKSKEEKFEDFDDLLDNKSSLCKRIRNARLKSGNIKWWTIQLSKPSEINISLLIFFTWVTPKTIIGMINFVSELVVSLSDVDFSYIVTGLKRTSHISRLNSMQQTQIINCFSSIEVCNNFKYLISLRFPENLQRKFIYDQIKEESHYNKNIIELKLEYLIESFLSNYEKGLLQEIKKTYIKIRSFNDKNYFYSRAYRYHTEIPYDIAKDIMSDYTAYPKIISTMAEKACRIYANEKTRPVGETAINEEWFEIES